MIDEPQPTGPEDEEELPDLDGDDEGDEPR